MGALEAGWIVEYLKSFYLQYTYLCKFALVFKSLIHVVNSQNSLYKMV